MVLRDAGAVPNFSPPAPPASGRGELTRMLHFELVTPEKLLRSEEVHMVVVPGTEGDFGVLEGHAPFMSTIRDGALRIHRTEKGEPETLTIRGGFAEVTPKGLTILAEHAA